MRILSLFRLASTAVRLTGGVGMLALAGVLLVSHADAIRHVRDVGIPAAVRIPELERHLSVLKGQLEAVDLSDALHGGSVEEMVHAYVLPEGTRLEPVLALFEGLQDLWHSEGLLHVLAPLRIGDSVQRTLDGAKVEATPLHIEAEMTPEGVDRLIGFFEISGMMTIADALSREEVRELIKRTEEEDPSGITVLEQFLSTDLLRYAREPDIYESLVTRSFASPAFTASFQRTISSPRLAQARSILGGEFGTFLGKQRLWPLRAMAIRTIRITPKNAEAVNVVLDAEAYSR